MVYKYIMVIELYFSEKKLTTNGTSRETFNKKTAAT